jgi:ArsR family transcriptional regulator, arsenate/arsenite/antimonite-responsive transcriptional repressor
MTGVLMKEYAEQVKALGDVTRMKIIRLLCEAMEDLCVCEIMDALEISHSNVSRHLKILKTAGIVEEEKEGRWVHFSLANPRHPFHKNLLMAVGNMPGELFAADITRLKLRLSLREDGKCVDGLNSERWMSTLNLIRAENVQSKTSRTRQEMKVHAAKK